MGNDIMSQKAKKEIVKAQINELIRLKTETLSAENKALKERMAQLEEEINRLHNESRELSDEEISCKAGRIIIDAQKTAQNIISDAKEQAKLIEQASNDRLSSLQINAKAAESAVIKLKLESRAAGAELDKSLEEIRAVINALETDKN